MRQPPKTVLFPTMLQISVQDNGDGTWTAILNTPTGEMKKIWKFLYFGWSCGWTDTWFPWAIGPHPRWANRISEFLHRKWLEDSWDL